MSIEISTRKEMAATLDSVMNSSYGDLVEELKLLRGHSLLKTYLLEAHTSGNAGHEDILSLIRSFFGRARKRSDSVDVAETHEEKLYRVRGTTRNNQFIFFIDAADSRFWVAHSLAKSEVSDKEVDGLLKFNPGLDSAWMPAELLQKIQGLGESRGLGLDFDRRYLDAPSRQSAKQLQSESDARIALQPEQRRVTRSDHFEYVKMQLWGTGADKILGALSDAGLGNSTTVSKVRLKTQSGADSDLFSLTDIRYDGKITGRGTSFDVYNGLLLEIAKRYSGAIRGAERRFRLGWHGERASARLTGEPIYIGLGDGLDDLEHFCVKLFSGDEPFRLLGRPVRRNANYFTASAVDLHVNQRIDFEISRSTLTVFLPQRTCANSILRLYTNLQHFLSSDVKAIDGTGARIFTFES